MPHPLVLVASAAAGSSPPYLHSGTGIAFWVLFAVFAIGEYVMRFRSRFVNRGGRRAELWSLVAVQVTVVGSLAGAFVLSVWPATSFSAGRLPLFIVGLIWMAAGVFFRQWAILALGHFFTADVRVRSGQTVVSRGPYRWVRHPSYTGLIVFFLGLGLALSNWGSLALLAVVPTLGLVLRIRSEERALAAALGDEYRRYAATRSHLFPGIW